MTFITSSTKLKVIILLFFYLLVIFEPKNIVVYTADSLTSPNWDPKCTEKWPGCIQNKIHYLNTACERANCNPRFKGCIEMKSDAEFRQMILDKHNELRNKVASGEEKRSNIVAAADMMALSYDLGLEFTAICHVHGCAMDHDKCRGTRKNNIGGQNLAKRHVRSSQVLWQSDIDNLMALQVFATLVVSWYETEIEKDDFKDLIDKFSRANHETGHFTAVIWAKVTHVGCSRAIDRSQTNEATVHITCNYLPSGNYMNQPIYTKGAGCSKCPTGTSCNKKYTSLCGEIDDKDVHAGPNPYRQADIASDHTSSSDFFNMYSLIPHILLVVNACL